MRLATTLTIFTLTTLFSAGGAQALDGIDARLTRPDGRPVRDRDLVTVGTGTRMPANAYKRVLEGWARRLRARNRVDAAGRTLPLLDQRSINATTRSASAARRRAAARGRIVAAPTTTMLTALRPLVGGQARPPLTVARSDRRGSSWGETWGDRSWVALRFAANESLTSATQSSAYTADFDLTGTVLGRDVPLAAGNVMGSSGGFGMATSWLDLAGQTYWALPATDGNQLRQTVSRQWQRQQTLGEFTFVAVFVPIKVSVGLGGRVGLDAEFNTTNRQPDLLARGALRTLQARSIPRTATGETREGAWADLSLFGHAETLSSLRSVAGELGIEGLLETIDAVPGVTIPWSQPLAGASLDLNLRLVEVSLAFRAMDALDFQETGPRAGRYSLNGHLISSVSVRALTNVEVWGSAFVSYPSDVDIDFVWGFPPVEITLEWDRISARERLWGWSGALYEDSVLFNNVSWNQAVQSAGGIN